MCSLKLQQAQDAGLHHQHNAVARYVVEYRPGADDVAVWVFLERLQALALCGKFPDVFRTLHLNRRCNFSAIRCLSDASEHCAKSSSSQPTVNVVAFQLLAQEIACFCGKQHGAFGPVCWSWGPQVLGHMAKLTRCGFIAGTTPSSLSMPNYVSQQQALRLTKACFILLPVSLYFDVCAVILCASSCAFVCFPELTFAYIDFHLLRLFPMISHCWPVLLLFSKFSVPNFVP